MSKQTAEQNKQQRRDTVLALRKSHHHRAKCADYLGISKQALGARIRKFKIKSIPYTWAKLPTKVTRKVRHDLVTIDMDKAVALYKKGDTFKTLGLYFKCSPTCIRVKLVSHFGTRYEEMKELNSDNRNRRKYYGNANN